VFSTLASRCPLPSAFSKTNTTPQLRDSGSYSCNEHAIVVAAQLINLVFGGRRTKTGRPPSEACLSYALAALACTMERRCDLSSVSSHLIELDERDTRYAALSGNLTVSVRPRMTSSVNDFEEQFCKVPRQPGAHVARKAMRGGLMCASLPGRGWGGGGVGVGGSIPLPTGHIEFPLHFDAPAANQRRPTIRSSAVNLLIHPRCKASTFQPLAR